MLKKYFLTLFLLIYSYNVFADPWSDISGCVSNLCSCGFSDINEYWGDTFMREVPPDPLCAPFNKQDGRNRDSCLMQFSYPATRGIFYLQYCAYATIASTYFTPLVGVAIQACNAASCWSLSEDLNWNGECVIWPGPYSLPLTRICARIAVPAVPPSPPLNPNGTPADPGYPNPPNTHLDEYGQTQVDATLIAPDGTIINITGPKLCAYSDPGLVNLVSDTGLHSDPLDWNPVSQPLQQTDNLSPIAQVLVFLAKNSQNMSWPSMIQSLLGMIGNQTNIPGLDVLQEILKAIGNIVNLFPQLFVLIIENLGSVNGSVDSPNLGCVLLPFGPYPPPFCPVLDTVPTPTIQSICTKDSVTGQFVQSADAPCVVSNVTNNYINNSVRISIDNFIPICPPGTDATTTDTCVSIRTPASMGLAASQVHTNTGLRDGIKLCTSSSDTFCIETDTTTNSIQCSSSVSANSTGNECRIVYAQTIGTQSTPKPYVDESIYNSATKTYTLMMPDCTNSNPNYTTCQSVWGINAGPFVDVELTFPTPQSQSLNNLGLLPLQQTGIPLTYNNVTTYFTASIVRTTTTYGPDSGSAVNFTQQPNVICVMNQADNSVVGCVSRVTDYQVSTYDCSTNQGGASCTNSYYAPQFILTVKALDGSNDESSTVVAPLTYPSPDPTLIETIVNVAGDNYGSFVANIPEIATSTNVYTAPPFSGPNSINPYTIYGNYVGGVAPYDSNGNPTSPTPIYLNGLETYNGAYYRGGNWACASPQNFSKCAPLPGGDQSNCVLTSLLNSDTINCTDLQNAASKYLNLRICNNSDNISTACSATDSIAGKNGNQGLTIYTCKPAATPPTYCYTNEQNNNTQVCQVSMDYIYRLVPIAQLKIPINNPGQNFAVTFATDVNGLNTGVPNNYDPNTAAIRDKTSQELNLCVAIPVPQCNAITTPTRDSGNATWPATNTGNLATGTCAPGFVLINANTPLQRYCLSDITTRTTAFQALASNVGCTAFTGLPYTHSSTFPPNIPINNSGYDNSTNVGTFTLGIPPSNIYFSPMISEGLYSSTFVFTIADLSRVQSFKIISLSYDDYVLVTVNGKKASSGLDSFSTFTANAFFGVQGIYTDGQLRGDQYRARSVGAIDLMPYLQQGSNTILIQLGVVGGGGLYYNMQYQLNTQQ